AALGRSSIYVAPDAIEFHAVAWPEPGSEVHGLVATDQGVLIAATSRGLRRSEDSGMTWQPVHGPLGASTVTGFCRHPSHPGVVFAARYGSIFSSVDDGRTWAPVASQPDQLPPIRELRAISSFPGSLFAITRAHGVYEIPLDPDL